MNPSGDDGRGGYRSQETIHSSPSNRGARIDIDRRGGYRSQTRHSSSHNTVGIGTFLGLSFYYCPVEENVLGDERVGYRSQTSHDYYNNIGVSGIYFWSLC